MKQFSFTKGTEDWDQILGILANHNRKELTILQSNKKNKKRYFLTFIILITFILGACSQTEGNVGGSDANTEEMDTNTMEPDTNETSSAPNTMPKDMPEDFNFSVQYGVTKKNEVNTFEGTATKDLIEDGTATAEINFTEEEMNKIYEKMKEINIVEKKKFTPEPVNGTVCAQEPHEEDDWKITINGETITHFVSGGYCEPTNDAKQMIQLRNYITKIVKSKDAYRALPNSRGGYS